MEIKASTNSFLRADVRDLSAQCDTDAELQDHRKRIQTLSEETAVSLKKNVYKNYMQFIETSKEISCILQQVEGQCTTVGFLPVILGEDLIKTYFNSG